MPHRGEHAVHRPAIFEVSHQIDVQVVEPALGLVYGIEVQHGLARMLVRAVTRVDDRDCGDFAGIFRRSFQVVPHYYHVGIVGDHHYRILEYLALGAAGNLRVGKAYNLGTQTVGSCLKTQPRPCARLEEKGCGNLAFEYLPVRMGFELPCHIDQIEEFLTAVTGDAD